MSQLRTCPECHAEVPDDAPQALCLKCLMRQALQDHSDQPEPVSPVGLGRFVAPVPAALAEHFPQLEILELLGQGGMGAVYKARQRKLDRLVALKIMPPEVAADPAFAERFAREARALARLNHPNIVAVHDFGESGGLYFFIMEFVDGLNLRQLMRDGPIEPAIALQIVPQICEALQYAHDEAIVHRDIKPENILVDKRGRVKIADFGLAKLVGHIANASYTLTGSQQIMGTPHYMAPEQMEKPSSVDHRADIYSLGVVFYEMLTGGLPLGRFALPSQKAGVDQRLDDIILHALEKEPKSRYQSISAVKTDIERVSGLAAAIDATQHEQVPGSQRDALTIRHSVTNPAAGLIFTGAVALFSWLMIGIIAFEEYAATAEFKTTRGVLVCLAGVAVGLAVVAASGILIVGGLQMMRLRSYGLAIATACVAALPWSVAFPLGLVFGIWAIAVLQLPDVKAAFSNLWIRGASVPTPGGVRRFMHSLRDFVFDSINRRQSTVAVASGPVAGQMPASAEAAVVLPGEGKDQVLAELMRNPAFRTSFASESQKLAERTLETVKAFLVVTATLVLLVVLGLSICNWGLRSMLVALPVIPFASYYLWLIIGGGYSSRIAAGIVGVIGTLWIIVVAHHNFGVNENIVHWITNEQPGFGWVVLGLDIWFFTWLLGPKSGKENLAIESTKDDETTLSGFSEESRKIRRLLLAAQSGLNAYVFPDFDAGLLSLCRKECSMPLDERVLGLVDFTGAEDGDNVLLIGTRGIYFCNYKNSSQPGPHALPYEEFASRAFVNHGREVYLGGQRFLYTDPDAEVDCEAVANLLNGIREIIVKSERGNEKKVGL